MRASGWLENAGNNLGFAEGSQKFNKTIAYCTSFRLTYMGDDKLMYHRDSRRNGLAHAGEDPQKPSNDLSLCRYDACVTALLKSPQARMCMNSSC